MSNSPNEVVPIQERGSLDGMPRRFIYRGPSMAPTFRTGDVLYMNPNRRDIAPGDVIVFHHQEGKDHVVHRVIAVVAGGFITRGDNNLLSDPIPILPDQIVGRVEKTDRGAQVRMLTVGWRGLWVARVLHAKLQIKRLLRRIFRRPYRWLKSSGIASRLWRPKIERIRLKTPDGPLVKYIHKGRTVASCWTATNCWRFKRPYDFILDPRIKRK
jgi:signal peptidase I